MDVFSLHTERNSTVGIQCDKWVYKKFSGGDATHITFYTWDFAGQVRYMYSLFELESYEHT